MSTFIAWPKTPRLFLSDCTITEKIDGSNSQVIIEPLASPSAFVPPIPLATVGDLGLWAGSRNRLIRPGKATDNNGFAQWVVNNAAELVKLGEGRHFGEWYGAGIQRKYGLTEKRFALFNVKRWSQIAEAAKAGHTDAFPSCCEVVPVLYEGPFSTDEVYEALYGLIQNGSNAVPGWMKPEGIIVFHHAAQQSFKVLLEGDDEHKGEAK